MATTTASSLEAEQDSGNIVKTQTKVTSNEPSSQGTSSGDGPRRQDTIVDTSAHTRYERVSKMSSNSLLAEVNTLAIFPVGTHPRPTVLKVLPVSFHLRQDLGVIVFFCTTEVFLIENLCLVGICLSYLLGTLICSTEGIKLGSKFLLHSCVFFFASS
nr:hypothetical protein [Tanacetum cinerariifolium]